MALYARARSGISNRFTPEPEVALPDHHLFDDLYPPAPSALFTGRTKELEFLESFLCQKPGGELAVHGIPGCGKTQLALKFARMASIKR
ncbi:hypothetical protein BDV93DRAFT_525698 [Ceratobasidium sp. AG-I]|nr:hypothetical protein BDV93DRAFT_525698 [Ceratobasidium sp. AG-I]